MDEHVPGRKLEAPPRSSITRLMVERAPEGRRFGDIRALGGAGTTSRKLIEQYMTRQACGKGCHLRTVRNHLALPSAACFRVAIPFGGLGGHR